MKNNFFTSRLKSIKYALNGLKLLFKEETNAKIHLTITIFVIIAGILFKISALEWIAVALSIALVMGLECINTAIENISDFVSPQYNEKIKKIKDISAGAVLLCAIAAFITGIIIFLPKIIHYINC